jgi:hypothetical protein
LDKQYKRPDESGSVQPEEDMVLLSAVKATETFIIIIICQDPLSAIPSLHWHKRINIQKKLTKKLSARSVRTS